MDRQLFNPLPPVSQIGRTAAKVGGQFAANSVQDAVSYVAMTPQQRNSWVKANPEKAAVVNMAKNMVKNGQIRQTGKSGKGGGGRGSTRLYNAPSGDLEYYAMTGSNPSEAKFETGIPVLPFDENVMSAIEDVCSPLHINCIKIEIPETSDYQLYDYFINSSAFALTSTVQSNVSWALDVNAFTPAKLLAAMNALINALSVYYYYNGVISYKTQFNEDNEGMQFLRTNMTYEMSQQYYLLKEKLSMIAVPPNLHEVIKWFYSNYRGGSSPKSQIFKICPFSNSNGNTMMSLAALTTAISDLRNVDNNKIYSIMRRAVPGWKVDLTTDVPDNPVYDPTWNTVWANLPYSVSDSGNSYFPKIATDEEIFYNSYVNLVDIDGGVFALTSMYNTTDSLLVPSLVVPQTYLYNTRFSFYVEGTDKRFYAVSGRPILADNRGETYVTTDAADVPNSQEPAHRYMSQIVYNVSERTVTETSKRMIQYLLSLEKVGSAIKRDPRMGGKDKSKFKRKDK